MYFGAGLWPQGVSAKGRSNISHERGSGILDQGAPELATEAVVFAKKESRTMSNLMREAFRRYKREIKLDENAFGRENQRSWGSPASKTLCGSLWISK